MDHYDPTDTAAIEHQRTEHSDREKQQARQDADDLKWLLSDKRGRRAVWRLLSDTGVFRSVFSTNALSMALAEGRRQVGLELMARITEVAPGRYATMVEENSK